MTEKPNEDWKAEKDAPRQAVSNQPSLQKTSEEIWNRFQRILFDIQTSEGENKRNYLSELGEFNHQIWIPADKAVLIDDVEKVIDEWYDNAMNSNNNWHEEVIILKQKLKSLKSQS